MTDSRYSGSFALSSGALLMISGVTASSISSESASSTIARNSPGTRLGRTLALSSIVIAVDALLRASPIAIWSRRKSATSSLLVA